jgi:hypothetical protein
MAWRAGKLAEATITAGAAGLCRLADAPADWTILDANGHSVASERNGRRLSFQTEAGREYRIRGAGLP